MIKYLTRRDIMELLCITAAQFEWTILQINIVGVIELNQRQFSIQNLINIYHYRNREKKIKVVYSTFESKINLNK